jgi:ankyrin repeat protein
LAVSYGNCINKEMVQLLISLGARVNDRNNRGSTPLLQAASRGKKDIVEILLSHGAIVDTIIGHGYTPLYCAVTNNSEGTVQLLRKQGAKALR